MIPELDQLFSSAPYPGLRPFELHETDIFFGRETQTIELLNRLRDHRFLAVVGSSGSGKSSLVRTGLMAALQTGLISETGPSWRIAELRPGFRPLLHLAEALCTALHAERGSSASAVSDLHASLTCGPLGLAGILNETPLPAATNLLVFVDQFEEIFRFRGDDSVDIGHNANSEDRQAKLDEADAFVALLLETLARTTNVHVLLAMRIDYLGNCVVFPGLPEALNQGQFLVPQLTRDQRRAAIEGPAKVFGVSIQPDFVSRLLADSTAPDSLPLLQHVLMRLWRRKRSAAPDSPITLELQDYRDVGTIARCLSDHAHEVLSNVGQEGSKAREIAEVLFRALTERASGKRDRRRPQKWATLVELTCGLGSEAEALAVVESFRHPDCAFLMPPAGEPISADKILDISHESLISHWIDLQRWVADEAESADYFRDLVREAEKHDGDPEHWLTRMALEKAVSWRENRKPTEQWARRYGGNLSGVFAFIEANQKKQRADEKTKRIAAESEKQRKLAEQRSEIERAFRERQWRGRFRNWSIGGVCVVLILVCIATFHWSKNRDSFTIREMAVQDAQEARASRDAAHEMAAASFRFRADSEWQASQPLSAIPYYSQAFRLNTNMAEPDLRPPAITFSYGVMHDGKPSALALDARGRWFAVALDNGSVEVITLGTTNVRRLTVSSTVSNESSSRVQLLAFSSNGSLLVAAGRDRMIHAWDTTNWAPVIAEGLVAPLPDVPCSLAVAPSGDRLAFGLRRGQIALRFLDGRPPTLLTNLFGATQASQFSEIRSLAFHPRTNLLAGILNSESGFRIWNSDTGEEVCERGEFSKDSRLVAVAFHPSGDLLLTASHEFGPQLWDLRRSLMGAPAPSSLRAQSPRVGSDTAQPQRAPEVSPTEFDLAQPASRLPYEVSLHRTRRPPRRYLESSDSESPAKDVKRIALTPDGQAVLWIGGDGFAHAWWWQDDKTGGARPTQHFAAHADSIIDLAVASSGSFIITTSRDRTSRLWSVATDDPRRDVMPPIKTITVRGDGSLVVAGSDHNGLRIATQGRSRVETISRDAVDEGQWVLSTDGSHLAAILDPDEPAIIALRAVGTTNDQRYFTNSAPVVTLALAAGASSIATLDEEGVVRVRDLRSGTERECRLKEVALEADRRVFSPKNRWFAVISEDGGITVRDLYRNELEPYFRGHLKLSEEKIEWISMAAFSEDEHFLAIASDEGNLWRLDLVAKSLEHLDYEGEDPERSLAINHDGSRLFTLGTNGPVILALSPAKVKAQAVEGLKDDEVKSARFLTDGSLALALDDGSIRILKDGSLSRVEFFRPEPWVPRTTNEVARMTGLVLVDYVLHPISLTQSSSFGIHPTNCYDAALADYWEIYWDYIHPVEDSLSQTSLSGAADVLSGNVMTINPADRLTAQDATSRYRSLARLEEWVDAHPNHLRASEARDLLQDLRNRLAEPLMGFGRSELLENRWATAEEAFRIAVDHTTPHLPEALAYRGFALLKAGRTNEADGDLSSLSASQRTGEAKKALALVGHRLSFDPDHSHAIMLLLDLAAWLDPRLPDIPLYRGFFDFITAQWTKAAEHFQAALQLELLATSERTQAISLMRARALRMSGETNAARDGFLALLDPAPNLAKPLPEYQIMSLALLGRHEEALHNLDLSQSNRIDLVRSQLAALIHVLKAATQAEDALRDQDYQSAVEMLARLESAMRFERSNVRSDFLRVFPEAAAITNYPAFHQRQNETPILRP